MEFNKYEIVRCSLYHEKVVVQKGDTNFVRIGLCPKQDRSKRLGCAHTMANTRFIQEIQKSSMEPSRKKELITDFKKVFTSIYQLDHRKGNLEKKYFETEDQESRNATMEAIKIVGRKHRELMDQLEDLLAEVKRIS